MIEIIPGILEKEWGEIEKKIEFVRPFAKTVQIDVADGKMVHNVTFLDPKPFKKYKDLVELEVHLMVEDPINYLKPFAEAGFKRFYGHVEKMSNQEEFVALGQTLGEVGLALDASTPLSEIKVPLDDLDGVLIMTINAGFSGQEFKEETLSKVRELRSQAADLNISVDGGINERTIVLARGAGANRFVSTSFLFEEGKSIEEQTKILEKVVE